MKKQISLPRTPARANIVLQVLEAFKAEVGEVPHLMKADVDAAFRRIPVKPDERWMCGIAFMVDGQVWQ